MGGRARAVTDARTIAEVRAAAEARAGRKVGRATDAPIPAAASVGRRDRPGVEAAGVAVATEGADVTLPEAEQAGDDGEPEGPAPSEAGEVGDDGAPREAARDASAARALHLAHHFNNLFARFKFAGGYRPELMLLGDSDDGDHVQHVRLVSGEPDRPPLLVAKVWRHTALVQIRTFPYLSTAHEQRFRRPLAIDPVRYDLLVETMEKFFFAMDYRTTLVVAPDPTATATAEPPSGGVAAGLRRLAARLLG